MPRRQCVATFSRSLDCRRAAMRTELLQEPWVQATGLAWCAGAQQHKHVVFHEESSSACNARPAYSAHLTWGSVNTAGDRPRIVRYCSWMGSRGEEPEIPLDGVLVLVGSEHLFGAQSSCCFFGFVAQQHLWSPERNPQHTESCSHPVHASAPPSRESDSD